MAVRIRKDGRILCAAFNGKEDGDVYLDDAVHYALFERGTLRTLDEGETWELATFGEAAITEKEQP